MGTNPEVIASLALSEHCLEPCQAGEIVTYIAQKVVEDCREQGEIDDVEKIHISGKCNGCLAGRVCGLLANVTVFDSADKVTAKYRRSPQSKTVD